MAELESFDGGRLLSVASVPPVGPNGGAYAKAMVSGTMAASLTGASPIFSFRFAPPSGGPSLCLVRRVLFAAAGTATVFTAGVAHFDMFAARIFSANDSGGTAGTLTTVNGKLRTAFGVTGLGDFRIASTGTLTPGTRTLDTDPMATIVAAVSTAASLQIVPPNTILYEAKDYPLALATSEGFVIQATVPATGTWTFGVGVDWDEVEKF